jgi:hypothetical protein
MTFRVLVLASVLGALGFSNSSSIAGQEPNVSVERTIFLRVTAYNSDERVRVRGALYGVGRTVQIVDQRTPIEWTAQTTMLNGIFQADDGKRIRVEITEAGRQGGASGFGTSVVVARGLPNGGFLMFPGRPSRPRITMRIGLPNGGSPLVIAEDGGFATAEFPGLGTFGFKPTFRDPSRRVVEIAIIEGADPNGRVLAKIPVTVGEASVEAGSSPSFRIAVTEIQ